MEALSSDIYARVHALALYSLVLKHRCVSQIVVHLVLFRAKRIESEQTETFALLSPFP